MKIKHIIWDWNGTLVDDGWLFVELINSVLKKRGLKEISLSDYRKKFCFPLEKYYQRLGFDFNVEPYDIPSMEFVDLYNKNKYRPKLYTGAKNLLKNICDIGVKNYLLSAQNESSLKELVSFYKIESCFEDIRGTDNFHARGKDLVASEILKNIDSHNCTLFIGDTNMDIEISQIYNANSIGITFGHQAKNRFKKTKKSKLINSFEDLDVWLVSKLRESL